MNPHALALARGFGSLRYSILFETTNDLKTVLAGFGLLPEPLLLFEVDKGVALAVLHRVLWKDMVHEIENMPESDARLLAIETINEHSREGCRYYVNRSTPNASAWNSLTDSTFDSGVIIQNRDGIHFCIWFEEED